MKLVANIGVSQSALVDPIMFANANPFIEGGIFFEDFLDQETGRMFVEYRKHDTATSTVTMI